MPDFQAIPLIADRQAVRLEPFAKESSASNSSSPVGVGNVNAGSTPLRSAAVDNTTADGELSPDEVAELQAAAAGDPANGVAPDAEASDLLMQLGIGAAGLAGVGAAVIGGNQLRKAMANRASSNINTEAPMPVNTASVIDSAPLAITDQRPPIKTHIYGPNGEIYQEGPKEELRLPAPTRQITDQREARFNQTASPVQQAIPDMNKQPREVDLAYQQKAAQDAAREEQVKLRGNLGQARAMKLREAGKTIRRVVR